MVNYSLNKYGMPSYAQANIDVRYIFPMRKNQLEATCLLVGKVNMSDDNISLKNIIQKVDMVLINLVLNYNF